MTGTKRKIKSQEWMESPFLAQVIGALGDARLVGGCVRDILIGCTIKDIDIATSQLPEKVQEILEAEGIKIIPTGIEHGTVTAIKGRKTIEITTLRKDIECDGRYAEVEYTDSWEEDASRRDFTMNALSMDIDGTIYDYFDGIKDLKKGAVKFVGDPEERVQEDYLRILRYFRFEAQYGTHAIDEGSFKACIKFKDKISTLSGERIQQEMLKLLTAPDPYHVLLLMKEEGVLFEVLPGAGVDIDLIVLRHLVVIEKEEGYVVPSRDAIIRLALLVENGKEQVKEICDRWKTSNAIRKQLEDIIDPPIFVDADILEKDQKRALISLGKDAYIQRLLYLWAQDEDNLHIGGFKRMLALASTWDIPEFPLKGRDILSLGVKEGGEVGNLLNEAMEYWEENDFSLSKEELIKQIKT